MTPGVEPGTIDIAHPVNRRAFLGGALAIVATPVLLPAATAAASTVPARRTASPKYVTITVGKGETYTVDATMSVGKVVIAEGGVLAAPTGYSLSMTVNGIETGQKLLTTEGSDTRIKAGTYTGDIVLTVADAHDVTWGGLVFPLRQAVYVGSTGVVEASSVLAAVSRGVVNAHGADNIRIESTGECFNGVYVEDGTYQLRNALFSLSGNGRCDFIGYGAAIVADGTDARVIVDGATIRNHGAVRTAVISDDGATVVVKNSTIHVRNGVLPSDYEGTVNTTYMETCPWMLGVVGNVRATNLLGQSSTAAYISTSVTSETWGLLSTDSGADCKLAAINSTLRHTGTSGYGTYVIGDATEWILGCDLEVATYASIFTGGTATYGDSSKAAVKALNESLDLGLTAAELKAIPARPTTINSRRWGFMWHAPGTLTIEGRTVVKTALATFLNKGQQIDLTVDGSDGVKITPASGVILQMMDNDDPGPNVSTSAMLTDEVYTQPTGQPAKISGFDIYVANSTDPVSTFKNIDLVGDFFNGVRGVAGGLNMVLNLEDSSVKGVISAAQAVHHVMTIDSSNYEQLGVVTNDKEASINNGVILTLSGASTWKVTGTSYLTSLTVGSASSLESGVSGRKVKVTVGGQKTSITKGKTYTGAIVVSVS